MKIGYIDTSVVIAMAFDDAGGAFIGQTVKTFDRLYSATSLESEFLSAAKREDALKEATAFIKPIRFIYPDVNLGDYSKKVLSLGNIDGSALHHLSTALYLFSNPKDVFFLSLHPTQVDLATQFGFQTEFLL